MLCRDLEPITQLYVSVDAATRETLKAIDRPLFKDFWERFQECLRLLWDKRQRTVYRLFAPEHSPSVSCFPPCPRPDFWSTAVLMLMGELQYMHLISDHTMT